MLQLLPNEYYHTIAGAVKIPVSLHDKHYKCWSWRYELIGLEDHGGHSLHNNIYKSLQSIVSWIEEDGTCVLM